MLETLREVLTSHTLLLAWLVLMAASIIGLLHDLRRNNPQIQGLMRFVWLFTVAYSGPLGLAGYYWSGRRQISSDSLWRRAFRSVSHCYSGCGMGEIVGVTLAAGILALGNWGVALITFALAYTAGFVLTAGPLIQEGIPVRQALWDAFVSDSASITVMEVVAIGVDLWLAGGTTMGEPLFWSSLVVSLTLGLAAAYPVNVGLIAMGVKSGMHDPREAHGSHAHC